MLEYLVSKLEGSATKIEPRIKEVISGIESSYVLVDEKGILLLVDQAYPNDSFQRLYCTAQNSRKNVGAVLFKDGKTFFRSAARGKYFKKSDGLSLKHYTDEEMHKMILFRPEESFLNSITQWLQYYQPNSDRLQEGIVSFRFEPVTFDYSHIDPAKQFRPHNTNSKKLHIWRGRIFSPDMLVLDKGYLKARQLAKPQ